MTKRTSLGASVAAMAASAAAEGTGRRAAATRSAADPVRAAPPATPEADEAPREMRALGINLYAEDYDLLTELALLRAMTGHVRLRPDGQVRRGRKTSVSDVIRELIAERRTEIAAEIEALEAERRRMKEGRR